MSEGFIFWRRHLRVAGPHSRQDALARLFEGRTSFVIAHRLSTITNADRIVVIHDGRIVEQGRHEELLEKQGMYYELYKTGFQE